MYIPRKDKGKERPIRYTMISYFIDSNGVKCGINLGTAKTMVGVSNFSFKYKGYDKTFLVDLKVEYTDKKTGITKQY